MTRPRIYRNAPVVPIDFDSGIDDDEPYEISGCNTCLPWHAEVVRSVENPDEILVREWHAVDCETLAFLLSDGET